MKTAIMKKIMTAVLAATTALSAAVLLTGCGESKSESAGTVPRTELTESYESKNDYEKTIADLEQMYRSTYPDIVFPEGFDFQVLMTVALPGKEPYRYSREEVLERIKAFEEAAAATSEPPTEAAIEENSAEAYRKYADQLIRDAKNEIARSQVEIIGLYYVPYPYIEETLHENLIIFYSYVSQAGTSFAKTEYGSYLICQAYADEQNVKYDSFLALDDYADSAEELQKNYPHFSEWEKIA